jgi:pimeloyl-ACP methyl ester carboxylesterase
LKAAVEAHPGWPLIVTGHSLGGGVAAVLAMLLREPNGCPESLQERVSCVALGCPAVMTTNLSDACHSYVTSLVLRSAPRSAQTTKHISTHACMYARTYTHTHTHTHTHIHTHTHKCIHTHIHTRHSRIHIHMHAYTRMLSHTRWRTFTFARYTQIHTHGQIHKLFKRRDPVAES